MVVYKVGDTGPGGGIVFITPLTIGNSTGKYFEVCPYTDEVLTVWCNNYDTTSNATGVEVGLGASNTATAIWFCVSGAIQIAADYANNGKTDWFLPSKDELAHMYTNRGSLDCYTTNAYWSSSEYDAHYAWAQGFSWDVSFQYYTSKDNTFYVRPVRSFN